MKTLARWALFLSALVAFVVVVTVVLAYVATERRIRKVYSLPAETVVIPDTDDARARGTHLTIIFGCRECHGERFEGKPVVEEPAIAQIYASNLTSGQGGIGDTYSDADLVRAIRHGVKPDGTAAWLMPSQQYFQLSDQDVGAMVTYLRSLPAVDHVMPKNRPGLLGRLAVAMHQIPDFLPAEMIDHTASRPEAPPYGATVEYGRYLSATCQSCHRPDFSGGPIAGPVDAPPATDLTPAGPLAAWTLDDFVTTLRTGKTPEGRTLAREWMPWPVFAENTDEELEAMWLYLRTLPASNTN